MEKIEKMNKSLTAATLALSLSLGFCGCIKTQNEVEIKPIEIKPIQINIDINVKVDRALDDFFSNIDEDTSAAQELPSTVNAKEETSAAPVANAATDTSTATANAATENAQ